MNKKRLAWDKAHGQFERKTTAAWDAKLPGWRISGDTFLVRGYFKSAGALWDAATKTWVLRREILPQVIQDLLTEPPKREPEKQPETWYAYVNTTWAHQGEGAETWEPVGTFDSKGGAILALAERITGLYGTGWSISKDNQYLHKDSQMGDPVVGMIQDRPMPAPHKEPGPRIRPQQHRVYRPRKRRVRLQRVQPRDEVYIKPSYWDDLCLYLKPGHCRPAVALVGPAGNGKTTAAEEVLKALGYEYEVIDATEYLEPADLIGAMSYDPKIGEVWRDGPLARAFRAGKGVLINEYDALNPRAALCLQSVAQDAGPSKTGRYVTLPGSAEGRVFPVGDCPFIVTMNTYGTGATREYVGRNTLDAANADRFTILSTTYEHEAEILYARGYSERLARQLAVWARTIRQKIEDNALRVILSLRTLLRMAQAIAVYGWTFDLAVEKEFLGRLEPELRSILA